MRLDKQWQLTSTNDSGTATLHEALGIRKSICQILYQRGITNYENAKKFFRPSLENLHDPFLMKDMDKAVQRIVAAFANNEKILVYGDYDVDGTTAVSMMYLFLNKHYEQVAYYIPNRYREGYGLSKAGIDYAAEHNYSLVITLDCGIKSVALIEEAKNNGIDFIICDHHLPDEILPPAYAILNAKQIDCSYPYKELCGCGVGFKLIAALCQHMHLDMDEAYEYLDLVATAIAADIVPMTGENRILTYYGLQKINSLPNFGLKALMHLSKVESEMKVSDLVFIIAPRVNAAGRMDEGAKAVGLFVAPNYKTALLFAEELHVDNLNRREADANITEEALLMIENIAIDENRKTTVLYQPHWHKGVVGIVASRLMDHYYRPTVVLTNSGDIVAGSARSVQDFNIYEAIHACKEHLIGYGGHFYAAGMTLSMQAVDNFSNKFEQVVSQTITPQHLIPKIIIDAAIDFNELSLKFFDILQQMEPYGPENLRPVFTTKGVHLNGEAKLLKEAHIKCMFKQDNISVQAIGFSMPHRFEILNNKALYDIVYTVDSNTWQGNTSLQIKLIDIKLHV
jgi:single-stranded-DNA-specific exonuclease